jgi:dihydroneopterin aldolase
MADTITLKGMRFHTLVGVYPHEGEYPQPVEIDLSVDLTGPVSADTVVDYTNLYADVAAVLSAGHIGYLEEIAEKIAGRVLDRAGVATVRVAVRKPHVALPGPLAYAELAITRSRPGV